MGQRLDAGNHLDPEIRRVGVQLPQLLPGIAAAHIPKIGFVLQLVGILGIQHQGIMAHQRQLADHILHRRQSGNRVAGAVEHQAVALKNRGLLQRQIFLRPMLDCQTETAEQIRPFRISDGKNVPLSFHRKAGGLPREQAERQPFVPAVRLKLVQNLLHRGVRPGTLNFQPCLIGHGCSSLSFKRLDGGHSPSAAISISFKSGMRSL